MHSSRFLCVRGWAHGSRNYLPSGKQTTINRTNNHTFFVPGPSESCLAEESTTRAHSIEVRDEGAPRTDTPCEPRWRLNQHLCASWTPKPPLKTSTGFAFPSQPTETPTSGSPATARPQAHHGSWTGKLLTPKGMEFDAKITPEYSDFNSVFQNTRHFVTPPWEIYCYCLTWRAQDMLTGRKAAKTINKREKEKETVLLKQHPEKNIYIHKVVICSKLTNH